jgi:hypothetical protein
MRAVAAKQLTGLAEVVADHARERGPATVDNPAARIGLQQAECRLGQRFGAGRDRHLGQRRHREQPVEVPCDPTEVRPGQLVQQSAGPVCLARS